MIPDKHIYLMYTAVITRMERSGVSTERTIKITSPFFFTILIFLVLRPVVISYFNHYIHKYSNSECSKNIIPSLSIMFYDLNKHRILILSRDSTPSRNSNCNPGITTKNAHDLQERSRKGQMTGRNMKHLGWCCSYVCERASLSHTSHRA